MPVKIIIKDSKYNGFLIKTSYIMLGVLFQSIIFLLFIKFFETVGIYLSFFFSAALNIFTFKLSKGHPAARLIVIGMAILTAFALILYLGILYFLHLHIN